SNADMAAQTVTGSTTHFSLFVAQANQPSPAPTPPPYTHSWYIKVPDPGTMAQLGASDGTWDDGHGTNGLTVLDFGELGKESGTYGAYAFDDHATFHSRDDIRAAAEAYVDGWYSAAGGDGKNARLKVVI